MSTIKIAPKIRTAAILLIIVAVLALPVGAAADGPPPARGIRITPIGNPTWRPVDLHVFSAPVGTAESGYAEFGSTMLAILPEPNHTNHPALGVGPGAPHSPPYSSEIAEGITALDLHQGLHYAPEEFSEGMGVWLAYMVVPAGNSTGSSPDFLSGPIIANSQFPIHVEGKSYLNNRLFSTMGDFDVPALDSNLNPPFDVDGHSHFPMFFADNADFGPPGIMLNGYHSYVITMKDVTGNGWKIIASFSIGGSPLPNGEAVE